MAQLTWRDVAAPDFSGAMNGIRSFNDILSQALGTAKAGVAQFQGAQDNRINKGVMARLAGITGSSQMDQVLPEILSAVDPSRLSEGTLESLMGRKNQLLNTENAQLNYNQNSYNFGRQKEVDAARAAAAPIQQQILTLREWGKNADAQKLFEANQGVLSKLGYTDFATMLRDGSNLARERQVFNQSGTEFDWRTQDRAFNQKVEALAGDIEGRSLDADSARREITSLVQSGKLDGRMAGALRQRLGIGGFPNLDQHNDPISGILGGAAGGGGGGDPTRIMNYEAAGKGFAAVPDSVRTLGDASNFAKSVNKAGVASSAMGMYQIVGDTMRRVAPDVFGANWQNVEFNAQNQDKLARRIFEQNRGSADALRKQWVSLTPAQAEAVRKMPWERARDIISQKESGGVASAILSQAVGGVQQGVDVAAANVETLNNNPLAQQFATLSQQTNLSPRQVATQLAKENPGVDAAWLEGAILNEMKAVSNGKGTRKQVNAAMVGAAIMANAGAQSAREGWGRLVPDFMAGNTIGGDFVYDKDATRKILKDYSTGQMDAAIRAVTARNAGQQTQAAGQAAVARMQQIIQSKIEAARSRGITLTAADLAPDLERLQRAQSYAAAGDQILNIPGMTRPGGVEGPTPAQQLAEQQAAAIRARRASRTQTSTPAPSRGPAPNDHSSAAARARLATKAANAASGLMYLNPVYWMGRAIDGR